MHRITMPRQGVLSRLPAHALCLIAERFFVQPRRAESPAGFVSRHPRMTISFPNWDLLSGNRKKTCARWELLPER